MALPTEKGIDPVQSLGTDTWDSYWLKWFKRLQNVFPLVRTYSTSIAPASVDANTTAEQTFTVTGLNTNDIVYVNKPSLNAGIGIGNVRVTASNTIGITYVNPTADAITPTTETYKIVTVRL